MQWRKNIAMTDALRLMDDIDTIMQLPDRVRELEQGKVCHML